jgi:signal peptidase II
VIASMIATVLQRRVELWIIGVVVLLDQVTKELVRRMVPLHESVTVIPGLLDFTHVRNTGAAFGIFSAAEFSYKATVVLIVALAALLLLAYYAARLPLHERTARLGLALVLGGAVGNLIDRAAFGYVTDFVDVYWRGFHFWAFNVADSAITIGAVILILDLLGLGRHVSRTV